jgi:hypothetical protein
LKNHIKLIVVLILVSSSIISSQTRNNLSVFYSLVDSSANLIVETVKNKQDSISINYQLPEPYKVFESRAVYNLSQKFTNLSASGSHKTPNVTYIIDQASVTYDEPFKDGFFGSFYIQRNFVLSGSIVYTDSKILHKSFNYTYADTVDYSKLSTYENQAYPFTTGVKPAEPFFSSIYEPAIVVGAAGVAVYLFFTVRSK